MRGTWLVSAFLACARPTPVVETRAHTAPTRQAPAPSVAGKWSCAVDSDCMHSCAQGAVASAWYTATKPAEMAEGCCGETMAPPQCIDGECVAYRIGTVKIVRDDACTRRP